MQAGDTLQAFADRINGTADVGVSASVVNDKLVLISRQSGSAGAIGLGGSAAPGLGFTTTQAAQDAAATINGLPVTSSGNTIAGAINGVDLNLAKVGATTVTVGADTGDSLATATAFVNAYNAVLRNVKLATSYDAATKQAGTLQGDQTMAALAGQLRNIVGGSVPGGGAYDSLAQVGITSARDGTLSLDQGAFTAALNADPAAVSQAVRRRRRGCRTQRRRRHRPPAAGLHQHLLDRDPRGAPHRLHQLALAAGRPDHQPRGPDGPSVRRVSRRSSPR